MPPNKKSNKKKTIVDKTIEGIGRALDPVGRKQDEKMQQNIAANQAVIDNAKANALRIEFEKKAVEEEKAKKTQLTEPEIFKSSKTGNQSGVTLPDGRTFLGLAPEEVDRIVQDEQAKTQAPQGASPVGTAANQAEEAQRLQQVAQQGVQITPDGRQIIPDESLLSKGATGAAAIGGGIVGAKTLGATGAAIGTFAAPGLGTLVGGILGGAIGFIGGAIGGAFVKQGIQERQNVKQAFKVFTTAKTNRQEILNMVNSGLITEGQARTLWREEKQNIYASQAALKFRTDNDIKEFLGNPGDELIVVNSYLALENLHDLEFEKALLQPDPSKILIVQQDSEQAGITG